MIVIGLTGSIGMGKSRAASMLRGMGIPVHDSDKAVHCALMPDGAAFENVALTFPDAWDKKTRSINRKKLGNIVFYNDEELKKLEKILHPIAKHSQMEFIKTMQRRGKKIIVLEIPLLFETNAQERVDYVVCVSAPKAIQRRRVLARKGMDEEKFNKVLLRQMPDEKKRALSDFVINTGLGAAQTHKELSHMIKDIKGRRL